MASSLVSTSGIEGRSVSRKPSKLVARSNTLHRSPHSHSGSGAGLWLANSPSPDNSTFAEASTSQTEESQSGRNKKVYHFSAELARTSFGGRSLTLGGGSMDYDPIYANMEAAAPSDDGDVDLDLSFDYISRFDRSTSSSDPQDSSGSAFDSSRERDLVPPTSHFSPDDTPESLQALESQDILPTTPAKSLMPVASSSTGSLASLAGLGTSPSPNAVRSMRANADWDKRRKAPPAPLLLTPRSEAKRQRQQAMQTLPPVPQPGHGEKPTISSLDTTMAGPSVQLRPASEELLGKSLFSPVTPRGSGSIPFLSDFGASHASHASEAPLPVTPLSATRRGAYVNRLPSQLGMSPENSSQAPHAESSRSAMRRAASTSSARAMSKQSSEALRRTPTATAYSPSNATPVQTRRARSHSNRSFRCSASLASLGPPPFPPPNEPLPSPALSPSFQSTSAYHTANDANSTPSKANRTQPSASSIEFSEAPRSIRSRTHRSSLDSFRTAISDGLPMAASNRSIQDGRRWASDKGAQPPPLPPLQRYEALFPGQNDWSAAQPSNSNVSSMNTASTLTSAPMTFSNTAASTATAMTWSMSDRSTPSTHHSPLTPFTPAFSDMMPGTASSKTHFTANKLTSSEMPASSDMPSKIATQPPMTSLTGAAATLKKASTEEEEQGGRGNRNTEQWILTQRQRKALLQHEELATHQRLLETDQQAGRLSIRADEGAAHKVPPVSLPSTEEGEGRSRQDSRSTESTDEEHPKRTLVISTASTPDERLDPFHFVSGQPSLMTMERAASQNALETGKVAAPMTRNRSGTSGPWPQSPLLLNFDLPSEAKAAVQGPVSPADTVHSTYATPQLDEPLNKDSQCEAVQGLGLDIDYPSSEVVEVLPGHMSGTNFAPITTDLLRQVSRYTLRNQQPAPSPHLSIQMSPDDVLQHKQPIPKEVPLARGSRQNLKGLGFDLVNGPSPVLPNDCRSPCTEASSGAPHSLTNVTVSRAEVDRRILPSQSIASSISAFVYNATPGPIDGGHLDVPSKPKTGSIGWRRNARSRESLGKHSDVKFVNIDLDDGGLATEVTLDKPENAKGQWVSKLWSAVSSPRKTSFNLSTGDRSLDLELANSSEEQSSEKPLKNERNASRGSFRPLSLVEKRQSSGRYHLDLTRQRFRSPTPGEDDEVAEKDARAVTLRLLAGSPRIPPPLEEDKVVEVVGEQSADLSAEEREKERIEALKKLRRMSAVERQKKRSSGIGYITSTSVALEASRLPYVHGESREAGEQGVEPARHGTLSRGASLTRKRMSMTVFGGKERASTHPVPEPREEDITGAPEHAWLDVMSPRIADSPSGFTPRLAFEPQDWNATSQRANAGPSSVNHIPLMLSGSATTHRQTSASMAASTVDNQGLTLSELDRARDEMRRLAGQGTSRNEMADDEGETFHTPMPDSHNTWPYATDYNSGYYPDEADTEFQQQPATELNDFGISPEKKEARLHRRTRTARFADDDYHHEQEYTEDQPTVSIFTRERHASGSLHHHNPHAHPPLSENRSRSKRRGAHAAAHGHGLFATPASLLDGNSPSKNMFWAGFLGMPWLWMIGGWYLTADGQLRHPSADKVDVWQHEPSMQQSPPQGFGSTTFGGSSYEQSNWGIPHGESGLPSMSYAASSTNTTNTTQTTTSDPNRPPPSRVRKSKTRSFGALLDTNPEVSFYQSPVRVVQEPQPSFGGVWRGKGMTPLMEVEEPRRSRLFAGYPGEFDALPAPADEPAIDSRNASPKMGYRTAMATKTSLATPWKDLERYVLLNRVAAILSGILVFAGFTGAVYAVIRNF